MLLCQDLPMKPYKIDPSVLHKVAKDVVGLPLEGGELLARTVTLLAGEYPDLIDPTPGRWVGSKAGGILGKVRFLYFSPREYVVIFGSPTGTQGFSGRYKHVEIHKFLLAGRIDSYDLESDEALPLAPLLPGGHACLERGNARGSQSTPVPGTSSTAGARWSPHCPSQWSTRCSYRWSWNPSSARQSSSRN